MSTLSKTTIPSCTTLRVIIISSYCIDLKNNILHDVIIILFGHFWLLKFPIFPASSILLWLRFCPEIAFIFLTKFLRGPYLWMLFLKTNHVFRLSTRQLRNGNDQSTMFLEQPIELFVMHSMIPVGIDLQVWRETKCLQNVPKKVSDVMKGRKHVRINETVVSISVVYLQVRKHIIEKKI